MDVKGGSSAPRPRSSRAPFFRFVFLSFFFFSFGPGAPSSPPAFFMRTPPQPHPRGGGGVQPRRGGSHDHFLMDFLMDPVEGFGPSATNKIRGEILLVNTCHRAHAARENDEARESLKSNMAQVPRPPRSVQNQVTFTPTGLPGPFQNGATLPPPPVSEICPKMNA